MKSIFFIVLFLLNAGATLTFGQEINLTSQHWLTEIPTYQDLVKTKTIFLYSVSASRGGRSYFEFKSNGGVIFWTDRRSERDKTNDVVEELINPYEGTYTINGNRLKMDLKGYYGSATKTYKLVVISNDEIKLIDKSRR